MLTNVAFIRKLQQLDPPIREAFLVLKEEIEKQLKNQVAKDEFRELRDIVKELVEAQKRTEARVEQLAEGQQSLLLAQQRTEQRLERSAAAQEKTEMELQRLGRDLKNTQRMVGALSDTVRYGLENQAMKALQSILAKRFGIKPEGRLVRTFLTMGKTFIECNIFGTGCRDGGLVTILGEAKSQRFKEDITAFKRRVSLLRQNAMIDGDVFLLMVTHLVRPDIESYAEAQGITVIKSFEL